MATASPLLHRAPPRRALVLTTSFLSSTSLSRLKLSASPSSLAARSRPHFPIIVAAQSNWFRVIQTVMKVGKDGIEAGTNLVPGIVPRSIARIAVTLIGGAIVLFVLKSFLSTVFFVLAMMGLIYFSFMAMNSGEVSRKPGSTTSSEDETLEEARRIMEKYK
ncbi:hypothetical protein J5N97_023084 [Dioscorea zingiberensis]|uniref:Uncharacterized protein n=1 Tax=Dioscorea zingiberensis TaxID=325984 RepID=A0A9D5CBN2_9LILI|nr:hypothetical protein J5N97_023084 [Dioscorea zingiberensis]